MPISWSELSTVGQITLIVLLLLSILTWSIIIDRFLKFRASQKSYQSILSLIGRAGTFNDFFGAGRAAMASPSGRVLAQLSQRAEKDADTVSLERVAKVIGEEELSKSERGLPVLATIGSTSPFIGLFGTVWGIIEAFIGIGRYGSPNLAVVAPGIAEALVCTAAGLIVAVPAVVAYNHFVSRVRQEARQIEQSAEHVIILHRKWSGGTRS